MKINIKQLSRENVVAICSALEYYALHIGKTDTLRARELAHLGNLLSMREVLTCEYVDNQEEE
jgi:hypothetical protein